MAKDLKQSAPVDPDLSARRSASTGQPSRLAGPASSPIATLQGQAERQRERVRELERDLASVTGRQRERVRELERDLASVTGSLTWRTVQGAARIVRALLRQDPRMLARRTVQSAAGTIPLPRVPDYDGQYSRYRERMLRRPSRSAPASGPRISIVVPTYNTAEWMLFALRRSVERQAYANWEICLADDASPDPGVAGLLKAWAEADPDRVKVAFLDTNRGIAGASQAAVDLATGDYVALLDHDDELTLDALAEVAHAIIENPDADFIYTDEDKVSPSGEYYDGFFKPAWSPDLMLSMMYTGHLAVIRRSVLLEAGGFRPGFDGSQDYDLILRVTELTDRIYHLPRVLYHWRAVPGSAAASVNAKPYAYEAAQRAIQDALVRRGIKGTVERQQAGFYRVRYAVEGSPKVTILMPTNGVMAALRRAVESLFRLTDYSNFELVVLDNSVGSDAVRDFVASVGDQRARYLRAAFKPFNFGLINNFGATLTESPLLLLLNDDTEVLDADWLTAMVELATQPGIGAVGAKLLYPDGRVQHGGVVLGIGLGPNKVAAHAHQYYPGTHGGYMGFMLAVKNYSAVTAACLMLRRAVFEQVGGFDDTNLPVAWNDVDLCLKIREAGYRLVWTPYATLNHHESLSRGRKIDQSEVEYMIKRWGDALRSDPFYNPNLNVEQPNFADFGLE